MRSGAEPQFRPRPVESESVLATITPGAILPAEPPKPAVKERFFLTSLQYEALEVSRGPLGGVRSPPLLIGTGIACPHSQTLRRNGSKSKSVDQVHKLNAIDCAFSLHATVTILGCLALGKANAAAAATPVNKPDATSLGLPHSFSTSAQLNAQAAMLQPAAQGGSDAAVAQDGQQS